MSEEIHIRLLTEQDLPFTEMLRSAAGWNQVPNDWRRYLACRPDGCFLAMIGDIPAATLTTTCFQDELAWIGMVLVHPDYRRRGLARKLMEHALAFLQQKKIRCVKLDATPQGKPLYDQLGFYDEWSLKRWKASAWNGTRPPGDGGQLRPVTNSDWKDIVRIDTEAFGVSREQLLRILVEQSDQALLAIDRFGEINGYGMLRKGVIADYLGPLVACSFACIPTLVAALTAGHSGRPLFWDIPDAQKEAGDWATACGMEPQRDLVRMYRPSNMCPGIPGMQWGIADPATG